MARVLVCHEWAVAREGMRTQLEGAEGLDHIATTASGMSAVIAAMSNEVDVIVTGLCLEGLGGAELIQRLRRETTSVDVKIIVLLPSDDSEKVIEALHLDPDGLILQECSSKELRFAVSTVAAGQVVLGSAVAGRLLDWFRVVAPGPMRAKGPAERGEQAALTAREAEVLELVAEGRSTDEIAADLFISATTVRSHLFRLRSKIGVRDRAGLVNFAFRTGVVRVA